MKSYSKIKTIDLAYIGMFVAVLTVCAWISIPLTVPFTMQTFGIFITVCLLGTKRSLLTLLIYMLLGFIGVPVFSGFGAGPGVLLGPTGGYLIGFIFTVLVTGSLITHFGRKPPVMTLSMIAGLMICYIFGTAWFMLVYTADTGSVGLLTTLTWCVFPFIIPDIIKIGLSVLIYKRVNTLFTEKTFK